MAGGVRTTLLATWKSCSSGSRPRKSPNQTQPSFGRQFRGFLQPAAVLGFPALPRHPTLPQAPRQLAHDAFLGRRDHRPLPGPQASDGTLGRIERVEQPLVTLVVVARRADPPSGRRRRVELVPGALAFT